MGRTSDVGDADYIDLQEALEDDKESNEEE